MSKLWGAMFDKPMQKDVESFSSSLSVDQRLWDCDITASTAHAHMLGSCGVLKLEESEQIVSGLAKVRARILTGDAVFSPAAEDVHSEIERLLRDEIGAVAGKLHTGRSRNDQVVTSFRLYTARELDTLIKELKRLQSWLCETAEKHLTSLLPGLTHMQHAQPVSLAHHLLAYFWMFARDAERLNEAKKRTLILPLGSAALAGTPHKLNRRQVATELGFLDVSQNSLDAVSDRDFAIEILADISILAMHLSRLAEEIVLWQTPEFGFIHLDDSVTTGSSIMPQKKNPDVAELIRGRTGRAYGALITTLTMMKGLPLAYNRDMQEDKEPLMTSLDNAVACTRLMRVMLESATFRTDRMRAALVGDFSNATDLADILVEHGVPFREAHGIVGRIINECVTQKRRLEDLPLSELQKILPSATEPTLARLQHAAVVEARTLEGGTSSSAVLEQLKKARLAL